MTHTLEPWSVNPNNETEVWCGSGKFDADKNRLGFGFDGYFLPGLDGEAECTENAHRIVACVNALAGIPTEAIKVGVVSNVIEALKAAQHSMRNAGQQDAQNWPVFQQVCRALDRLAFTAKGEGK